MGGTFVKLLKKLFGGIDMTWKKVIVFAVVSAIWTAAVASIPQLKNTSFHTIAETLEVWIFFGIILIMNAESNVDSALKCFVFFLISQPMIYLLQVPFSPQGWGLFTYYPTWFAWTVFCLPMGYIGYYIKKGKWWGYLILFPMIALTAYSYYQYLTFFTFCRPFYLLISLFCAAAMIVYPLALFEEKKIRITGALISLFLIAAVTVIVMLNPYSYSTDVLGTVDGEDITDQFEASIADESMGKVYVQNIDNIDCCMVRGDFVKRGKTELTVRKPDGQIRVYDLTVEMNRYEIEEKQP